MKSLIGGSSGAWRAGKLDDIFDLSEDDLDVAGSGAHEIRWLVRQPHLVMFEALSLVVAFTGSGLMESAPV